MGHSHGHPAAGSSRHSIPNNMSGGSYYHQQQMLGHMDRRMSEPVAGNQHAGQYGTGAGMVGRPSSTVPKSSTVTSGAASAATAPPTKVPSPATNKLHPNQEVVLDEVEEDEMVENKLVIPDEMLQYLNQVADQESKVTVQQGMSTPNSATTPADACAWNPNENSPPAYPGGAPPRPQPPSTAGFNQPQSNLNKVLMSPQSQYSNDDCSMMSNVMSPQTPQHQMMSPMMPAESAGPLTPSNYGPQPQPQRPAPPVQCQIQNFNGQIFNNNFPQNQPPQLRQIACSNLIGYFHRTDQSAHHCCLAMMMQGSLHINQPSGSSAPTSNSAQQYKNPFSFSNPNTFPPCQQSQTAPPQQPSNPADVEIQCGDISQSQLSPPVVTNPAVPSPSTPPSQPQPAPKPMESSLQTPPLPSTPTGFGETSATVPSTPHTIAATVPPPPTATTAGQSTMGSDTYQRTLEYVQNCQNWVESAADMVSSSTHPTGANAAGATAGTTTVPPPPPPVASSNLVINDMSTSLSSYFEEDRYLQMIQ